MASSPTLSAQSLPPASTSTNYTTQPSNLYPDYESKWQALINRDPKAARCFLYCVKSTGIFCRPTCAARLARQKNVVFFDTIQEAEAAGFRPCKRCKPMLPLHDTHHSVIRQTCKLLDESPKYVPHLKVLAEKAGFTQWHFHRIFRRFTGITPRMYWEARHSPNKQIKQKLANIDLDELVQKIAQLDENTVIDHDLIKSSYSKRPRSKSTTSKASTTSATTKQKKLPDSVQLDEPVFLDEPLAASSTNSNALMLPTTTTTADHDSFYSSLPELPSSSGPHPMLADMMLDFDTLFPSFTSDQQQEQQQQLNTPLSPEYTPSPTYSSASDLFSDGSGALFTPPLNDVAGGINDQAYFDLNEDLNKLLPPLFS